MTQTPGFWSQWFCLVSIWLHLSDITHVAAFAIDDDDDDVDDDVDDDGDL